MFFPPEILEIFDAEIQFSSELKLSHKFFLKIFAKIYDIITKFIQINQIHLLDQNKNSMTIFVLPGTTKFVFSEEIFGN